MSDSTGGTSMTLSVAGFGSMVSIAALGAVSIGAEPLLIPGPELGVGGITTLLIGVGGVLAGLLVGIGYERYTTDEPATRSVPVDSGPNQYRTFFEQVPTPAVGISIDEERQPIVEHVNANFEEVFGFDAGTLEGESLAAYIVPPEKRDESAALVEALSDGYLVESELQRETTKGFRTFAFTGVPVGMDDADVDAYAVYSDVTTEREQKQRLQVLYRVLRHDLRNRMNVVKGNAEIICEEITDPELREWAEALSASADELIELSSQTRQIERSLDAGDYERHTVDATRIVEDVLDDLSTRHPDVEVRYDAPDELAVVANGLIDTAIGNAVENAFEHNTGPTRAVHVIVRSASQSYAEISVRDDGPGIPDSERRLFDGGSEITQLQHASGLGLWLLNWIVTQSGGEIELLDVDPTGTEVRIRLPLAYREEVGSGARGKISGD